jgi:hypothetical protein
MSHSYIGEPFGVDRYIRLSNRVDLTLLKPRSPRGNGKDQIKVEGLPRTGQVSSDRIRGPLTRTRFGVSPSSYGSDFIIFCFERSR